MLTDFRSVFGVPFTAAESERGWGNADEGAGVVGGGNRVLEGARSPVLLGVLVSDLVGVDIDGGWSPEALRVLAIGSAGRAMVGGPLEGREGLGNVVVILRTWKGYQAVAFWPRNDRPAVLIPPVQCCGGKIVRERCCGLSSSSWGRRRRRADNACLLEGAANTLVVNVCDDYPKAS